jgi:peptide-methionine (S)-S-oxide reductase
MIKEATFGAGCFWCIEACFKEVKGVIRVFPGYSGGEKATANYTQVSSGLTQHAEVARIEYDDSVISYEKLLELFWFVHDPTQWNRQGNDIGSQYRSVIFYHDEEQRLYSEAYKKKLTDEKVWDASIVTEIVQLEEFYVAEEYHHNYLENNPLNPYCQSIVRPKIEKFRRVFSDNMK